MFQRGELNSEEIPPEVSYDMDEKGFSFSLQSQRASTYESQKRRTVFHKRYGEKNPYALVRLSKVNVPELARIYKAFSGKERGDLNSRDLLLEAIMVQLRRQ